MYYSLALYKNVLQRKLLDPKHLVPQLNFVSRNVNNSLKLPHS